MSDAQQNWPPTIIVSTREIMARFEQQTRGLGLRPTDFQEIITQVVDLLLNFGPDGCSSYQLLPDVSRLVQNEWPQDESLLRLKNASFEMAWALHNQCAALGFRTYRAMDGEVKQDFPYRLSGWHGHDLVLDHMPY